MKRTILNFFKTLIFCTLYPADSKTRDFVLFSDVGNLREYNPRSAPITQTFFFFFNKPNLRVHVLDYNYFQIITQ